MSTGNRRLWTKFAPYAIVASCSVLVLSGCGKKKDKDAATSAPIVSASAVAEQDQNDANMRRITANQVPGATMKCMLVVDGKAGEWKDCPAGGEDVKAEPGHAYEYKVKAVANGVDSSVWSSSFIGKADSNTDSNTDAGPLQTLILNKSEVTLIYSKPTLTLSLGVSGGAVNVNDVYFECKRERETTFTLCPDKGSVYNFTDLAHGNSYALSVRAVVRSTLEVAAEDMLSFSVQLSDNGNPNDPNGNNGNGGNVPELAPTFLVGGDYTVRIPQGLHVQQYSSEFNTNAALTFYRISPTSDPYAIGNDSCNGPWDMTMPGKSPRGATYQYCYSTNTRAAQDYLLERRFANNHLQLATDPDLVNGQNQEVILFNMFSNVNESFYTQSRFATLCQNGIDGFQGLNPVRRSNYPLAFANGFFGVNWKYSELWTCDVMLAGSGPNWGQPEVWKVGAFYIMDYTAPFPDFSCNCGGYQGRTSMLEVVYMKKTQAIDAFFARDAQNLFLRSLELTSTRPN